MFDPSSTRNHQGTHSTSSAQTASLLPREHCLLDEMECLAFSRWLDKELIRLEERFTDFRTKRSVYAAIHGAR